MNTTASLLLVALTLATSGCAGGTEPTPPVVVEITIDELIGPTTGVDASGNPTVSCEIALRAVVAGDRTATWQDATFRTLTIGDPSTREETTQVSASVVREVWGADAIGPSETQTSRWIATKPAPFSATLQFQYQSGARMNVSTVGFTCRP